MNEDAVSNGPRLNRVSSRFAVFALGGILSGMIAGAVAALLNHFIVCWNVPVDETVSVLIEQWWSILAPYIADGLALGLLGGLLTVSLACYWARAGEASTAALLWGLALGMLGIFGSLFLGSSIVVPFLFANVATGLIYGGTLGTLTQIVRGPDD